MRTQDQIEKAQGFDPEAALRGKEEGIEKVTLNNEEWRDEARRILTLVAGRGLDFTADDVKVEAMKQDLPAPKHPNAWGALFNAAARAGDIVKTGQYRKSRWASNHAHYYPVWRKARR